MPNLTSYRQDPVLIALGGAIRRARLACSLSQEELALKAEIDRSHLGRIERGDNNVAILTLARIAQATGITVAKLMEDARL
ncbi:helix-turn-helix protein [Fluviicoccus keumensis]|uniref:Helix-turn-helix protein n=1 Tax=Fluviicoccus keumensis TaxID=1435465 RepID=A0A4Q7ZB56_9GAMM|nr:helix-turn-helix protein [Fluviicoccus keumensis]